MTTVADSPLAQSDVRLVWNPDGATDGFAAAWWPRSRDAATELRALLPAVNGRIGGTASRVSLNIDAWGNDQPRGIQAEGNLVRLGWFRTLDPATVTVGRSGRDRLTLLVVPADSTASAASELLRRLSPGAVWPAATS